MENKFLQIKKYVGEGCNGYYYAERLGKDSVAFILHDRKTDKFGLVREFKPPVNDFLVTAFGGSIDKPESLFNIMIEEVKQESGYHDFLVYPFGSAFVSTQMNQFCHLFLVDVTDAILKETQPENHLESISSVVWLTKEEVIDGICWKAITILTRSGL